MSPSRLELFDRLPAFLRSKFQRLKAASFVQRSQWQNQRGGQPRLKIGQDDGRSTWRVPAGQGQFPARLFDSVVEPKKGALRTSVPGKLFDSIYADQVVVFPALQKSGIETVSLGE